jgi:NAD(P)H-hydrate epimerase
MKIFTASQIRACDEFTIHNEPITSHFLMERAAQKCTDYLFKYLDIKQKIYIFCGNGNNGGDGFAIARMLYYLNFDVEIYINKSLQSFSKDATINFNFLKELSGIEIKDFSEFDSSEIDENEVIIDAVFGSGLNRKLEGELAETIEK